MSDPSRQSPQSLGVTYIGHSTVAIDGAGSRFLTDPLLRPSLFGLVRRRRPLSGSWRERRIDAVLISHADHDHLDLGSLLRLPRGTPLITPVGVAPVLYKAGFGPVIELEEGERTRVGGLEVEAVPARHEARRPGVGIGTAVGYVIDDGSSRVYFAGDTDLFPGMRLIGDARVDLALLPISGWGPTLGEGHLDPLRAAEALTMLRPRLVVPIHWGTYTLAGSRRLRRRLTDGPQHQFAKLAAERAPGTEVRVLEVGESLIVPPRTFSSP